MYFSHVGNHTFVAVRGSESYSLLESLKDVFVAINDLIKHPEVEGYRLHIVVGGDYKVIIDIGL